MKRVIASAFLISVSVAGTAAAQGFKLEISGLGGYTWTDGVKAGKDVHAGNGETYDAARTTNSGSFGFSVGVVEGHGEYGFLFRRQLSTFQVSGTTTTTIGDMNVDNYHGYLTYYFGDPANRMHVYASGGAGMSHFGPVSFTPAGGGTATIGGRNEFSTTFGAGLRIMANDHFGFRVGVQWTPIHLTADPDHTYCDPYWGCYLQANPQYASQVDLLAGVTWRLGKQ